MYEKPFNKASPEILSKINPHHIKGLYPFTQTGMQLAHILIMPVR